VIAPVRAVQPRGHVADRAAGNMEPKAAGMSVWSRVQAARDRGRTFTLRWTRRVAGSTRRWDQRRPWGVVRRVTARHHPSRRYPAMSVLEAREAVVTVDN